MMPCIPPLAAIGAVFVAGIVGFMIGSPWGKG